MKLKKWIGFVLIIAGLVGLTSCVSPFYGTARIEKGLNLAGGVGVSQFEMGTFGYTYLYTGPRADLEVGYAFNNLIKPYIRGGLGYGWLTEKSTAEDGGFPGRNEWLWDAAAGVQLAYPDQPVTPAIRVEVGTSIVSADMMFGIGYNEWLTLGMRTNIEPSFTPYVIIHPIRHLSIFASPGTVSSRESGFVSYYTLGIGYSIK